MVLSLFLRKKLAVEESAVIAEILQVVEMTGRILLGSSAFFILFLYKTFAVILRNLFHQGFAFANLSGFVS